MVTHLGLKPSLLTQFIAEVRDEQIQRDPLRFRANLERISEIFAYEISKKLEYKQDLVKTPLGESECAILRSYPVIASIMRAGLPMHQGFLNYFDRSPNAFISAYRKYEEDGSFDIRVEYVSSPVLEGKDLIIVDPMLATAASMVLTVKHLMDYGTPASVHIATIIASRQGVAYLKRHMPVKYSLWLGATDEELTAKSYIVPGLGDAGDLAFGTKQD
jgi:uracil phosphoribosyltransferase